MTEEQAKLLEGFTVQSIREISYAVLDEKACERLIEWKDMIEEAAESGRDFVFLRKDGKYDEQASRLLHTRGFTVELGRDEGDGPHAAYDYYKVTWL